VVVVTEIRPTATMVTPVATPQGPRIEVGVVELGQFQHALLALRHVGIDGDLIPPSSTTEAMRPYDVIWLATGWAEYVYSYGQIADHPGDFLTYVQDGGGLFVEQPNPFGHPENTLSPALLPYPITIRSQYDPLDWPPILVDPAHPITEGLANTDMPFPADQVVVADAAYTILVRGGKTQSPSLLVAEYGAGRIVIFMDSAYVPPESRADTPPEPSAAVLAQALSWLRDGAN
jgi:hypothetical protein